jgi:bifunctional UDP-N-acetylglucosamine pyrophosphorylase / glucosamine-1-phosphate N-acetyltransferase
MKVTAIVLAAGQGTRMRSSLPKVLHPIIGRPLILHSLDKAVQASTEMPVVVLGFGSDEVRKALGDSVRIVYQEKQLGTANAVQAAETLLAGEDGLALIVYGDMPLFLPETLQNLVKSQANNPGPLSILTVHMNDSHGFGRVVRAADGSVVQIVEEAQATPWQMAISELNVGAYCCRLDWLWDALRAVKISPKGEYYLTDLVEIASKSGYKVQALVISDPAETLGVNNRIHLSEAEAVMRRRINQRWMMAGVTLIDPANTYIEPDVVIGQDTVIYPNSLLRGSTIVGEECVIGPGTVLTDAVIGKGATVFASVVDHDTVGEKMNIGPFVCRKNVRGI